MKNKITTEKIVKIVKIVKKTIITSTMQQWTPGIKFNKSNNPKVKNPAN